jgi:hypothetical protein
MELWGAMTQRFLVRMLCGVVGAGWGVSGGAVSMANPPSAQVSESEDAADLADASADTPVLRALSISARKAITDKNTAADIRTDSASKPSPPVPASKAESRPLGETLHAAAKDLAIHSGAADAKQYLGAELGLDKPADASGDVNADASNALRRRATGDSANSGNVLPPRSNEQLKLDEEQASFLASALVREVTPWAIGAAVLMCILQGLRLMLAFSRRQTKRKRKYRRSGSGNASRNARM